MITSGVGGSLFVSMVGEIGFGNVFSGGGAVSCDLLGVSLGGGTVDEMLVSTSDGIGGFFDEIVEVSEGDGELFR